MAGEQDLCRSGGLDPLLGDLSSVEALELETVLVLVTGDFDIGDTEDDLDVAGVALVRVDATVGTVCPSASFLIGILDEENVLWAIWNAKLTYRGLLHNDGLDGQILELQGLGVSVGLGVFQ